jgi:hypothetical protein
MANVNITILDTAQVHEPGSSDEALSSRSAYDTDRLLPLNAVLNSE